MMAVVVSKASLVLQLLCLTTTTVISTHAFIPQARTQMVSFCPTRNGLKWKNHCSKHVPFALKSAILDVDSLQQMQLQLQLPPQITAGTQLLSFLVTINASTETTSPDEFTSVAVIAGWTLAFSSLHIGMSAVRNSLIQSIGEFACELRLVGRGWMLPDIWPGDEAGQEIFPTAQIAGRQLYRIVYTIVSFFTLGSAFQEYYLSLHQYEASQHVAMMTMMMMGNEYSMELLLHWIAAISMGCSIGSLINPSPLSLVPVYETRNSNNKIISTAPTPSSASFLIRDDASKLQPRGLTRITRHPLILPVLPWAVATALSLGGHGREWAFFGMLALYSIAGCYAQDLRLVRREGSVGTVVSILPQAQIMTDFIQSTSLVPFQAIVEGRQKLVLEELPWLAIGLGSILGYGIQGAFLDWLVR